MNVSRHSPHALGRLIERLAALLAPRHRDLARGMVAELDAITDPGARTRFGLGAVAAVCRLALGDLSRTPVPALSRLAGIRGDAGERIPGGPSMPLPTGRQVLRRHVGPFAIWLGSLTALLLTTHIGRLVDQVTARGGSVATIVEAVILAVPFCLALAIPMAVFLAVSQVFAGLGAEGVLAAARRAPGGLRRLVVPVLWAAAVVAGVALVNNSEIVPRTNTRLVSILAGAPQPPSDRSLTIAGLRDAASRARRESGPAASVQAAAYEVEIQKKVAMAAACLVLTLAGVAAAVRFPRGGRWLVAGAGLIIFGGYWLSLVAGEAFADRQVVSPWLGMWLPNLALLGLVSLLASRAQLRQDHPGHGRREL